MSITLPVSLLSIQKFLLIIFCLTLICSVNCVRSSSSSAESTGASGSSAAASSLMPTSSNGHHHRGDRELISAQFRAHQDGRDLDTSEPSASISGLGLDSLAAAAAAAGLDEDSLALSKYMSASASAYPPTKIARLNRYPQSGLYDPYPSYAPAGLNSIPSSYYPYNAYATYRDSNPMLDNYPYYERDRIRDLRERAMQAQSAQNAPQYSNSVSSSSSNRDGYSGGLLNGLREGFRSTENDNAMSPGHHHDEGHGHGGWGWGMYTSKVNTNAIGLLGLLGLLSLLSNVLMQFTTTTTTTTTAAAAGGRKKRSLFGGEVEDAFESREQRRERVFMEILPHLTPVAHAKDGVIPLECTFHGVCMANKLLVNEFGMHGRAGGMRISSAIVKLLEKVGNGNATESGLNRKKPSGKASKYSYTGKKSSDIKKKLESAGLDGRNKKDCQKSYPVCNALRSQVMPRFPFDIRMQDLPQLISKANKMTLATAGHRRANGELNGVPMKL